MRRKDFFVDESASLLPGLILSFPIVAMLFGSGFDWAMTVHATRSVKDNITHAVVAGTQYLYRAQGTIQPNCALGGSIAQYAANRKTVFNILRQVPFDDLSKRTIGGWKNTHRDQITDKPNVPVTYMDPDTQRLQASYGWGSDRGAKACDFSSIPLTPGSKKYAQLTGDKGFFSQRRGITVGGGGQITITPENRFYVTNFAVQSSKYDKKGKLERPSSIRMCVIEFSKNQFLGRVFSPFSLSTVKACSESSTFLGRTQD